MTKEQKKLAEEYHYLIGVTIRKMNIPDYAKEDYYGVAAEGLCNAAIKYTPDKGPFQAMAVTCIRNSINSERRRLFSSQKRGFGSAAELSIDDEYSKYMLDQKSLAQYHDLNPASRFYDFCNCLEDREKMIIKLIEQGYIYKEIAAYFGISLSCVKKVMKRIKRKYLEDGV